MEEIYLKHSNAEWNANIFVNLLASLWFVKIFGKQKTHFMSLKLIHRNCEFVGSPL